MRAGAHNEQIPSFFSVIQSLFPFKPVSFPPAGTCPQNAGLSQMAFRLKPIDDLARASIFHRFICTQKLLPLILQLRELMVAIEVLLVVTHPKGRSRCLYATLHFPGLEDAQDRRVSCPALQRWTASTPFQSSLPWLRAVNNSSSYSSFTTDFIAVH